MWQKPLDLHSELRICQVLQTFVINISHMSTEGPLHDLEKNQAQSSDKAPLSPERPHLLPNTTSDGFIHAHNVANNLTLAVMMALKWRIYKPQQPVIWL